MEKMHAAASTSQTAATSANAKHRAAQGQGGGVAGDFLGLLASLSDDLMATVVQDTAVPDGSVLTTPEAPASTHSSADTTLMSSLLALQAGFAGNNTAGVTPNQQQSTSTLVSNSSPSLAGPAAITANSNAQPASTLVLNSSPSLAGSAPSTNNRPSPSPLSLSTEMLAVGSRGVALASTGGELGLVAQTAAFDGALEAEAALQSGTAATGAGKKVTAARGLPSGLSTVESWSARAGSNPRPEGAERTAAITNLTASLPTNGATAALPEALALAAGRSATFQDNPSTANTAAPTESLAGLLVQEGQNGGRSGEGRGSSAGQNPDTQGLYSIGAAGAEPTAPGENPMFDLGAALPTEDSVAEQVAYWVNQNIQNAELTVEHDGHPVQVTVSLNGNEAHVSFTSDQNETRALLDAGVAQLRDLLESQGLVLSGMSVGEASTQGQSNQPNGQRGSAPTDARQTTVESHAPTRHTGRADVISDQAVDVFV